MVLVYCNVKLIGIILQITQERLKEKEEALERALESARELSTNLMELELSKMTPASDTCKGKMIIKIRCLQNRFLQN